MLVISAMNPSPASPPNPKEQSWWSRKPSGSMLAALALWGFFLALAGVLEGNPVLRLIVAVACCVAYVAAMLLGERALMRSQDELQQKIRLEALALAWPVGIGATMLTGMLQSYGLIAIEPQFMFLPGLLSIFATLAWSRRRYQ